jgi:hypothetical protein
MAEQRILDGKQRAHRPQRFEGAPAPISSRTPSRPSRMSRLA